MKKDEGKKARGRFLDLFFCVLILLLLLLGLIKTVWFPKEINYYENRYAFRIQPLRKESFLDGSFQNSMEEALADNVPAAQRMKKSYHDAKSALLLRVLEKASAAHPELFFRYKTVYLHDGYLLWQPFEEEPFWKSFEDTVAAVNHAVEENPELPFYLYYIETDAVCDFSTGKRVPVRQRAFEELELPADHCAAFTFPDFETYRTLFYRTDHHWNHRGSYRAYLEILRLLDVREAPLEPLAEISLGRTMVGSKAKDAGLTEMSETPGVYVFDFPDEGIEYGRQEAMTAEADGGAFTYGDFYGGDYGLLVFDTKRPERESILVLGESYDNAILRLLASHFDKLYSVDMRLEESRSFSIGAFAREHEIDKVLFIGSQVLFCGDFLVEG